MRIHRHVKEGDGDASGYHRNPDISDRALASASRGGTGKKKIQI